MSSLKKFLLLIYKVSALAKGHRINFSRVMHKRRNQKLIVTLILDTNTYRISLTDEVVKNTF